MKLSTKMRFSKIKVLCFFWVCMQLSACGFFVSNATQDFGDNLTQALLNHNDPEIISSAIPAYLLLLEAMIINDPENEVFLLSASSMYGAYIGFLSEQPDRRKVLSARALDYALRSICIHDDSFCQLNEQQYQAFETIIKQADKEDLNILYNLGVAWALWIQNNQSDWNAIAQLAQVKAIMRRVTELENGYRKGNAFAYLGVLETILPPALGGNPELGKSYFEKAIMLSEEKSLMVKVIYAKQYARMMFDRELHDTLLHSVIKADAEEPGLTLLNVLAKKQAASLLDSADQYF